MIDFSASFLIAAFSLCYGIFVCFLLLGLLVVIIIRLKVRKEVGLWKAHNKYHPDPAEKEYTIRD